MECRIFVLILLSMVFEVDGDSILEKARSGESFMGEIAVQIGSLFQYS